METKDLETEASSASDSSHNQREPRVSDTYEETNTRRRRLVRGALVVAPAILTLRSGALAAQSCVGAKEVSVTLVDSGGESAVLPATDNNGGPVNAAIGDSCIQDAMACQAPDTGDHKIIKAASGGSGMSAGEVVQGTGGNLRCSTGNTGNTVAILSSTAAGSWAI